MVSVSPPKLKPLGKFPTLLKSFKTFYVVVLSSAASVRLKRR
jgi:hypothetical protein